MIGFIIGLIIGAVIVKYWDDIDGWIRGSR